MKKVITQIALFWTDHEEPFQSKGASVYDPEDTLGLLGEIMTRLSQHQDLEIEWQELR